MDGNHLGAGYREGPSWVKLQAGDWKEGRQTKTLERYLETKKLPLNMS